MSKTNNILPEWAISKLTVSFEQLADEKGFEECRKDGTPLTARQSVEDRLSDLELRLIRNFVKPKVDPAKSELTWEYCEPGRFDGVLHTEKGDESHPYDIPPDIMLTGIVTLTNGERRKFFKKFVSHPFYQWGQSALRQTEAS